MMKFFDLDDLLVKDPNGARLVPISKSTVYRMISAGTFPAPNKLGRRSVWSAQDIDSWREKWLEDEL